MREFGAGFRLRVCSRHSTRFRGIIPMSSILLAAFAAALVTSPSEPSDVPRFGEVQLSSGIRMHYAEQGESRGEPIILLHGYSDSWFSFSKVLTPLARESRGEPIILLHGYSDSWFSFSKVRTPLARESRVYALDLRGHGKTDKPAAGYHMRDLAA